MQPKVNLTTMKFRIDLVVKNLNHFKVNLHFQIPRNSFHSQQPMILLLIDDIIARLHCDMISVFIRKVCQSLTLPHTLFSTNSSHWLALRGWEVWSFVNVSISLLGMFLFRSISVEPEYLKMFQEFNEFLACLR